MSDTKYLWDRLVTAALVGLEREPMPNIPSEGAIAEVLNRIDDETPERRFLVTAAALSVYRSAGRVPSLTPASVVEPCDLDDLPLPGPNSMQHLVLMLRGEYQDLLAEWLMAVAARGKRIREDALPTLLDWAKGKPELWDAVRGALGKRGQWLAAQNPEWNSALANRSESDWQTGSRAERLALLHRLRITEPDRARELVESTWAEETPDDRAAFVKSLLAGLSMGDEPFLESALDDKRKEVRRAASDLLARLPDSRLCGRMIDRLRPLITFYSGQKSRFLVGGRKACFDITLPTVCDKEMDRDGIDPKPRMGMGEKAWWLSQMIGTVAPDYWSTAWQTRREEIVEAAMANEWKMELLEGFALAARRHGDSAWLEILIPIALDPPKDSWFDLTLLMQALPADRIESIVTPLLRSKHAIALINHCNHGYSHDFSREVLRVLARCIAGNGTDMQWWTFVPFANHISISVYQEAVSSLPSAAKEGTQWSGQVEKFLNILKFRHDMLEAI